MDGNQDRCKTMQCCEHGIATVLAETLLASDRLQLAGGIKYRQWMYDGTAQPLQLSYPGFATA